jgi:hypothetical protein
MLTATVLTTVVVVESRSYSVHTYIPRSLTLRLACTSFAAIFHTGLLH